MITVILFQFLLKLATTYLKFKKIYMLETMQPFSWEYGKLLRNHPHSVEGVDDHIAFFSLIHSSQQHCNQTNLCIYVDACHWNSFIV